MRKRLSNGENIKVPRKRLKNTNCPSDTSFIKRLLLESGYSPNRSNLMENK